MSRLAIILSLAALGLVAGSAPALADGPRWLAPQTISGSLGPSLVSCTSPSFCLALDFSGNAFTYDGTSWSGPHASGTAVFPSSVSCASPSFCVAVDSALPTAPGGKAVMYRDGSWGAAQQIDTSTTTVGDTTTPDDALTDVSCVPADVCVAVSYAGDAYTYDGTTWGGPVHLAETLAAVSCVSTTFCIAVDQQAGADAHAFVYDGNSWTPEIVETGPPETTSLSDVSCASTSFCLAIDQFGAAFRYDGIGWSAAGSMGPSASAVLRQVSCAPGATACVAVDRSGNAASYIGGNWGAAQSLGALSTLTGVSCAASDFCVATDVAPVVIGGSDHSGTAHVFTTTPLNTVPPTISGTTVTGSTLVGSPGAWSNVPTAYVYQWLDCDAGGAACTAIGGATSGTYALTAGDVGHTIALHVTAANSRGAGLTVSSAPTALVTAPVHQSAPLPPTAAQIKASLAALLKLSGKSAGLAKIFTAGGYTATFTPVVTGKLTVSWYTKVKVRVKVKVKGKTRTTIRTKRILVAQAKATIKSTVKTTVKIKLTTAGRALFAHAKKLSTIIQVVFTPTGAKAITVTKTVTLNR